MLAVYRFSNSFSPLSSEMEIWKALSARTCSVDCGAAGVAAVAAFLAPQPMSARDIRQHISTPAILRDIFNFMLPPSKFAVAISDLAVLAGASIQLTHNLGVETIATVRAVRLADQRAVTKQHRLNRF